MKEPRNHVVTFRLSESEYLRLKSACETDQVSISAIVRHTILDWAERPGMDQRLGEISERLGALVGMLNKDGKRKS